MIKQKKRRGCGCSGHPSGRPKVSHGPCYGDGVRPAVRDRIDDKRIVRAWLTASDRADVEA
jgi:hypothetical protein